MQFFQEAVVRNWRISYLLSNSVAIELQGLLLSSQTLVLAYVGPSRLNAGYTSLVNSLSVSLAELKQGLAGDETTIKLLRFNSLEYFGAQSFHLGDKLGPHLLICQVL